MRTMVRILRQEGWVITCYPNSSIWINHDTCDRIINALRTVRTSSRRWSCPNCKETVPSNIEAIYHIAKMVTGCRDHMKGEK